MNRAKTFAEAKALFTIERVVGACIDLTFIGNYPCKPFIDTRLGLEIINFLEEQGGDLPYIILTDLSNRVYIGPPK